MKNKIILLLVSTLLFSLTEVSSQAGINCSETLLLSLDETGNAMLTPELVLDDIGIDFSSYVVSPASLSASDLGIVTYQVTSDSSSDSCSGSLQLFDFSVPSLACKNQVTIIMNDENSIQLHSSIFLSGGPYDYSLFTVTPGTITDSDLGVLTYEVYDSKNDNLCWGELTVLGQSVGSSLSCNDQVNVSTQSWNCGALLTPDLILASPIDDTNLVVEPEDVGVGTFAVSVMDVVTGDLCWTQVVVEDKVLPVPIVSQNVVIEISMDQTATLLAEEVDNGSFDNCSEVTFSPEFWEFDCGSIGDNVVTLTVTDASGNSNSIWTRVRVEPFMDVVFICPEDVVVDCSDVQTGLLDPEIISGGCTASQLDLKVTEGVDYNEDGDLDDLIIGPDGNEYGENFQVCGNRIIRRTWSSGSNSCHQNVFQRHISGFDESSIVWPSDITVNCLADDVEEPTWDESCDIIGFTQSSEVSFFENGACQVITHEWSVINWCELTPGESMSTGIYTNVSTVTYLDVEAPEILVSSEVVIVDPDRRNLSALVESDCATDEIKWEVMVDLQDDDTYDYEFSSFVDEDVSTIWDDDNGNGIPDIRVGNDGGVDNAESEVTASGVPYVINLPRLFEIQDGVVNRVVWKAYDSCGNMTTATMTFILEDEVSSGSSPVVVCLSKGIYSIPPSGGGVTVNAIDFNSGSYDDVTLDENLRFTFSPVAPEQDPEFDPAINSSTRQFFFLPSSPLLEQRIYVWDEDGNSNFCRIRIQINNPFGAESRAVGLSFPDITVLHNDTLCIPLMAENFDCISSVSGTVTWDPAVLEYIGISDNGSLPGLSEALNFNTTSSVDGWISFVWSDFFGAGNVTLPDGDDLFEVCFIVRGMMGESTELVLGDGITPLAVSSPIDCNINNQELSLNVVSQVGLVTVDENCSVRDLSLPGDITIFTNLGSSMDLDDFLLPENLINNSGFAEADVQPIFVDVCTVINVSYVDLLIDAGNVVIIERDWILINWFTGESIEHKQTINVVLEQVWICDTLPNDTVDGDCSSGHTLEDDVEWPADISITDHRITPDALIVFSGIEEKNARPIFFNSPELYAADFLDFVEDLTSTTLVVRRQWNVLRDGAVGFSWQYDQRIEIDITNLEGIVSAQTMFMRPMPDVQMDGQTLTDEDGVATVIDPVNVSPFYEDLSGNGRNVRDIALIFRHIAGSGVDLNALQLIAADINGDSFVDSRDLAGLSQSLISRQENVEWIFFDQDDLNAILGDSPSIDLADAYVGIKPGDVDDTASLRGSNIERPEAEVSYEDVLVNAGEYYDVPIIIDSDSQSLGIELRLDIDESLLEVMEVTTDVFSGQLLYEVNDGILSVLVSEGLAVRNLDEGTPLVTIRLKAKGNTILSQSFGVSDQMSSLLLDEQLELFEIVENVDGVISTDIEEIMASTVAVTPNPASTTFSIVMESGADLRGEVVLRDMSGRVVKRFDQLMKNDISDLNPGMYSCMVMVGSTYRVLPLAVHRD